MTRPLLFLLFFPSLWAAELFTPPTKAPTARELEVITVAAQSTVMSILPTGSMKPAFDENYLLLVQKRPWKGLKVGQVIVFWATIDGERILVFHRVWRVSSGGTVLLTKGDANPNIDPSYVTEANYEGLVVGWVMRDLGVDMGAIGVTVTP